MNLDKNIYEASTSPALSHLNVGSGIEISIKQLAELVVDVVGFKGNIVWDKSMPDGAPRKLMDSAKISDLGWSPRYSLVEGIKNAYNHFLESLAQ
jgi:GDP-L-fucose synthase